MFASSLVGFSIRSLIFDHYYRPEMPKDRLSMMVASAALVFSTSCTPQPVKPIEIKGPLVDTPQSYTPWKGVRRAVSPPAKDKPPDVPGSNADLENRISKIHSDIKTLDETLKPKPDGQDK
jgi:hypothetical protein